jgi:hypothetical protein
LLGVCASEFDHGGNFSLFGAQSLFLYRTNLILDVVQLFSVPITILWYLFFEPQSVWPLSGFSSVPNRPLQLTTVSTGTTLG